MHTFPKVNSENKTNQRGLHTTRDQEEAYADPRVNTRKPGYKIKTRKKQKKLSRDIRGCKLRGRDFTKLSHTNTKQIDKRSQSRVSRNQYPSLLYYIICDVCYSTKKLKNIQRDEIKF